MEAYLDYLYALTRRDDDGGEDHLVMRISCEINGVMMDSQDVRRFRGERYRDMRNIRDLTHK